MHIDSLRGLWGGEQARGDNMQQSDDGNEPGKVTEREKEEEEEERRPWGCEDKESQSIDKARQVSASHSGLL